MNSSALVRDLVGTWTVNAQSAMVVGSPCAGTNLGSCCLRHRERGEMLSRRKLVIVEKGGWPLLTEEFLSQQGISYWVDHVFMLPHSFMPWTDSSFRFSTTTVLNISEDGGGGPLHLETDSGCFSVALAGC